MIFRSTYSKPILLVGNGVRTSGAIDKLHEFADKTDIPILTTMNGVDLAQDKYHIGFIGTHGNRIANMILEHCDLIISIGARLSIRQVGRSTEKFAPNAHLIRCDVDEYELSRNIKENEEKYQISAADFLDQLLLEKIDRYTKWKNICLEAKDILKDVDIQLGNRIIEEISQILPSDPIVSVDVGMNQCWCAQSMELKGNRGRIHISGGYGTMGCALPFSIGSAIANRKQTHICIAGDGGMQMNIQELETIKRENLPIKIFIINNKVLGKIEETQRFEHGGRCANTAEQGGYTIPDFCRIAEAYGIESRRIEEVDKIKFCDTWVCDDKPHLVNIIATDANRLVPKIDFETVMITPKLDGDLEKEVDRLLSEVC